MSWFKMLFIPVSFLIFHGNFIDVRFKAVTVVMIQATVHWIVIPWSVAVGYQ